MISITEKIRFIASTLGAGKLSAGMRQIDIWCPFCAHLDRSKKKLSIRLADDLWHCWTCDNKGRSLKKLLKHVGVSRDQFVEYHDKFLPENQRKNFSLDEKETKSTVITLPIDRKFLVLEPDYDPDTKAALLYAKKRGLTRKDLWYYRICISDDYRWRRRLIFPSFDSDGKINYFVARAIDQQRIPKYDNPEVEKSTIIFNEMFIDWTKPLVICEGVMDMCKCGENAVPLLGSTLNEESLLFNMIIANRTPVLLALDTDMQETKTLTNAQKLVQYDVDVKLVDLGSYADPGSMTKLEFEKCSKSAKSYSWTDKFSAKLARATRASLTI